MITSYSRAAWMVLSLCHSAQEFSSLESCLQAIAPEDHKTSHTEAWSMAGDFLKSMSSDVSNPIPSWYPGLPREIHLGQGASSSELTVTWVTSDSCNSSWVSWGTTDTGEFVNQVSADTYTYTTPPRWWPSFNGFIHSATIGNLIPGEAFQYAVGDSSTSGCSVSDVISATAPPAPGQFPAKFAVMADVGSIMPLGFLIWNNLSSHFEDLGIDATVHVGDISYAGMDTAIPFLNVSSDDEFEPLWDLYGEVIEPFTRHRVYQVGVGNHEAWYNWTAVVNRYPMRHQPQTTSADQLARPPFWYSYEIGGAHFTMLSSEHDYSIGSLQYEFIIASLENVNRTRTPWSVVGFHRPYYCSETGYSKEDLRFILEPLLLEYGVDLVLTGHEHGYERIHPVESFNVTDMPQQTADGIDIYITPRAPVYLMIGNGGAAQVEHWQSPAPEWSAARFSEGCDFTAGEKNCATNPTAYRYTDAYGFGVVQVLNHSHLFFDTHMASGVLSDRFWIQRAE